MNALECPFCHKNKIKIVSKIAKGVHRINSISCIKYTSSVRCNCCHTRGPIASGYIELNIEDISVKKKLENNIENKAIELWNNR